LKWEKKNTKKQEKEKEDKEKKDKEDQDKKDEEDKNLGDPDKKQPKGSLGPDNTPKDEAERTIKEAESVMK